jgi:hypothetical protein
VSKDPTRTPSAEGSRVPKDVLVAAVLPLKDRRTFVFETFAHRDWDEVRSRLPEEYRCLSDQQLMDQAVNLRKRGGLSSQEKKSKAALWREVKKAVRAYWSGGTGLEELGDLLDKLGPAPSATEGDPRSQTDRSTPAADEGPAGDENRAVDEHTIRALTLKPQFAELVARGEKLVENRTWGQKVRGRIAIHRGGKYGAIIAVATVDTVVDVTVDGWGDPLTDEQYAVLTEQEERGHVCGPLCWILKDVRRVEPPIPCKGKLNLWKPSEAVARELEAREGTFLPALGSAIGTRGTAAAVSAALRRRGESELAASVPAESESPALDAAIDALKDLF